MKKYRVLFMRMIRGTVYANEGDIVYDFMGCDYGLANDDTRATGVEHVSVSPNSSGEAPSFTIPKHHLQEIEEIEER